MASLSPHYTPLPGLPWPSSLMTVLCAVYPTTMCSSGFDTLSLRGTLRHGSDDKDRTFSLSFSPHIQ